MSLLLVEILLLLLFTKYNIFVLKGKIKACDMSLVNMFSYCFPKYTLLLERANSIHECQQIQYVISNLWGEQTNADMQMYAHEIMLCRYTHMHYTYIPYNSNTLPICAKFTMRQRLQHHLSWILLSSICVYAYVYMIFCCKQKQQEFQPPSSRNCSVANIIVNNAIC